MDDVRVLITMDVEPVKRDPDWTGPEDADTSERVTRAYVDVAHQHGFPVTFFIHPEAAELHRQMFLSLEDKGACLGLHLHATKFQYPRHRYDLGYYSAEEQRKMLIAAGAEWAEALGRDPVYFRPGAFSANDSTFPTLVSLGFRGGSLSVPGRVWPERYCIWAGAEPYPHRVNQSFRQVPGDMPFANIPLSVDFSMPMSPRRFTYYQDLRPSARGVSTEQVLRNIIGRIAEDKPAVPVIHLVTHNDQPFDNPDNESRRRLELVLKRVKPICEEHGLTAVGTTVEDVCEIVLALPPQPAPEWREHNDVET